MLVLETMYLTRNLHCLEEHIDHMSLQALLFGRVAATPLGPLRRARLYFEFQRRLTD
jgi:hypothetical protein